MAVAEVEAAGRETGGEGEEARHAVGPTVRIGEGIAEDHVAAAFSIYIRCL
jgi:hypothetical protein